MAPRNRTLHLRDREYRVRKIWILLCIFFQRPCHLLWRRQAKVGKIVSPNRVRKIAVQRHPRKVRAIAKEQIEVADVLTVVVARNEALIFLTRRLDLKAVDSAV